MPFEPEGLGLGRPMTGRIELVVGVAVVSVPQLSRPRAVLFQGRMKTTMPAGAG